MSELPFCTRNNLVRTSNPTLICSDSQREFSISKIFGDSYCVIILKTIKEIPKAVAEIQHDTRIPISTIYGRIQILRDMNLLEISGCITSNGTKKFLYKADLKSIEIKLDDKLEVKVEHV